MRKILVVVVFIVLVVSAGAYVYLYQPFATQMAMETVLPADTLGMMRVCEWTKQFEQFKSGRIGQAWSRIDLPVFLEAMGIAAQNREQIIRDFENVRHAIESPWMDALFGQDAAIAVLNIQFDSQKAVPADLQDLLNALVMVAKPKHPVRILESMTSMFGTQLAIEPQPYEEWTINQFHLENGQPVYYALTDGLLIGGLSISSVKNCLKQSLNSSTALIQAPAYTRNCADLFLPEQTNLVGYLNAGRILTIVRKALDQQAENDPDVALLKAELEQIKGIDTINFAQYDDGSPLIRSKMVVGVDAAVRSYSIAAAMKIEPQSNPTLSRIPRDTLLYSWQNTLDLKSYWEQFQQLPETTPETVAQIREAVLNRTGMPVETLLASLGNQIGLMIKDIQTNAMFPVPELAIFVQVKQPDIVDKLIKEQLSQAQTPLQNEAYNGTTIQYVNLPMGTNLSPAYAFSDGFWTLAINRSLLKNILDAPKGDHLGRNPTFMALGEGMSTLNNHLFYAQTNGLVNRTRELLTMAMSWIALTRQDPAIDPEKFMNSVISPLLNGLSSIKAVGSRTYIEDNRITNDLQILLDNQHPISPITRLAPINWRHL